MFLPFRMAGDDVVAIDEIGAQDVYETLIEQGADELSAEEMVDALIEEGNFDIPL